MRLSDAQRELVLELATAVGMRLPELLSVWKEAGDKEPPPRETIKPDDYLHFTTMRRLPADMKPEDGSLRYAMPPPFEGAQMYAIKYFYEPAPPTGFPSLLVVVAWSCDAKVAMATPPTPPTAEA
jgi:hypothetical protein